MATNCRMKFHGVRAFHPVPGRRNIAYGGNTSCIELCDDSSHIFINAGFGLNQALPNWLNEHKSRKDRFHCAILFSDLFWDSILGLPFFAPIHFKSSHLELFSSASKSQMEEALNDMSSNRLTPFNGIDSFPSKISIHGNTTKKQWGQWTIMALPLSHPLAPYPLAAWRLIHTSGIDIGIVMISSPDERDLALIATFLEGVKTLVCAASNGPQQDAWSQDRTTFDDALKLGLLVGTNDLYLSQFHPEMTDIHLQSELRKLSEKLPKLSAAPSKISIHLASEVESFISLSSQARAKAG